MNARTVDLDDLILAIHAAALAEDGWTRVGNDLCRAFGADGASLVRPGGTPTLKAIKPWCRLFELEGGFVKEYVEHWGQHDTWYEGALRTGRTGVGLVNIDSQLIDQRDFKATAFYNDFLRRVDIDRMMNICLVGAEPDGSYGPVAMSFFRGVGKESFSSQQTTLFAALAPHLVVAFQNYWAAQSVRSLEDARSDALDAVTSAVFGITSSGRVALMNRAGEELIRKTCWVEISTAILGPAKSLLEGATFSEALSNLCRGISFRFVITDASTRARAIVRGAPVCASQSQPEPYPASVAALVWITPVVPDIDVASDLASLCGLTAAEERLVRQLIAGDDLREAASKFNISLHTARSQLKSIFSKTGRRTQAALLSFAGRLAVLRSS